MGWPFIHVMRDTWRSQDNWGTLFLMRQDGDWEKRSYVLWAKLAGAPEITISAKPPPYYPIKLKGAESVVV